MTTSSSRLARFLVLIVVAVCLPATALGQTYINSFNPGLGTLNGIGHDDSTGTIYVHANFSDAIELFDHSGNHLGSIPDPGDQGNDSDYFFSSVDTNIGGTTVAAHSLLIIEGETYPRLLGVDPTSGQTNWESGKLFTLKSVSSPVVAGNVIFATAGAGGAGRESAAICPGDAQTRFAPESHCVRSRM